MKKKISLILSGLMLTAALAGCGNGHTHTAGEAWQWNGTDHWHLCECGAEVNPAAHNVGDDMRCADCGVEVWDLGEGYIDITAYDEFGAATHMVSYEPDGNISSEYRWERTYDADGNVLTENFYVGDFLQDENTYAVSADWGNYMVSCLNHQEDGYAYLNEYDEFGNLLHVVAYDPDGNVFAESNHEYVLNDDGEYYEAKVVEVVEGEKYEYEYNAQGDITSWTSYQADGTVALAFTYEYGYNEEGDPTWEKKYSDGKLVYEIVNYAVVYDDEGYCRYPEMEVEYNEDGSKLVREFGENTEVAVETLYNADGSEAYVYTYAYEINELDGQTVTVTDQNGEVISQTVYDADGEIVE